MKLIGNELVIDVPVEEGQRLSNVKGLYPLPSGAIVHKKLPGLGATHGEILAPRHSIIVLPNTPVIESKVAKHNERCSPDKRILGVYKGIGDDKVTEYFNDDTVTYKKILTTPESYNDRLKEKLLKDQWPMIKQEYYLLVDECERAIQDKDYRTKISAPFDDFFEFKHQGLISATTLPFSDPRFETLVHYHVKPLFAYVKPLTLVDTNNIVAAFREYIKDNPKERYYIFLNSLSAITALIEALDIGEGSKIHCSEKRRITLRNRKFNASSELNVKDLAKYNFFTSRYYSGLDIELGCKADVVMITEVVFAEHSILDPMTEVIQIVGRFRHGVSSITHITNFNPELECKNEEEARVYLQGQRDVYLQIIKLKKELASEGAQGAINDILKNTEFCRYFHEDGSYNYFMLDNYIQEQRVLGLYKSVEHLLTGYELVKDHFEVTRVSKPYPLSDSDRLRIQSADSKVAEIKEVVNQLKRLKPTLTNYTIGGDALYNELVTAYPVVAQAYHTIGEQGIIKCKYKENCMKRMIDQATDEAQYHRPEVLTAVHAKFHITQPKEIPPIYIYIETTLQDIYDRHGIVAKAKAKDILRYFEGKLTTTTIDKVQYKAYRLLSVMTAPQLSSTEDK